MCYQKSLSILDVILSVLIVLDGSILWSNGKVTTKIINSSRDLSSNRSTFIGKHPETALNLETKKSKLKVEDLYEHVSEKDVNERSFIFIHGSKFKIPHFNVRLQSKNGWKRPSLYKTFVSNIDSAYINKYGNIPNRYEDSLQRNINKDITSAYYNTGISNSNDNEMKLWNKKVEAVNGAIGLQYYDRNLKNYLVNMHSKYPGLLSVEPKGRYPKNSQIKLKAKVNKSELKLDGDDNDINEVQNLKKVRIEPVYMYPTVAYENLEYFHNFVTTERILKNNAVYVDHEISINQESSDDTSKDELNEAKQRLAIELLKPPLLRSKTNVNNKKKSKNYENEHIYPHDAKFRKSDSLNIPYKMRNNVRLLEKAAQDHYKDNRNANSQSSIKHINFFQDDSQETEETEFHDARLINKIEEIKNIDTVLQDDNAPNKMKSKIKHPTEKLLKNAEHEQKYKKVKNKPNCVYPGCEIQRMKQNNSYSKTQSHKAKCECTLKSLAKNSAEYSKTTEVSTFININTITDIENDLD